MSSERLERFGRSSRSEFSAGIFWNGRPIGFQTASETSRKVVQGKPKERVKIANMPSFKRFEDIQAWQVAREITTEIYKVTASEKFAKDFGLRDQARRASVSIMANIAEGFGRKTNKDFAHFLVQSHGSAAEVQSHLYVALDLNYIDEHSFFALYEKIDHASRMIMSLSRFLQKS